jgi:methyl-accepting chemotaxis protein
MLASERIKTEHSLQEIKSMIAQFEKHNQSAVKDIQSSLAQMESATGPM